MEETMGDRFYQFVEKLFFPGWSKTFRCKARDIRRNEAYFAVRCNDEG
jgi:hypothetical protein